MFLSSLIVELSTKEENNKAGPTLIFGGQSTWNVLCSSLISNLMCIYNMIFSKINIQ